MREAVRRHIPAGTEELDMKAYEEGVRIAGMAGTGSIRRFLPETDCICGH